MTTTGRADRRQASDAALDLYTDGACSGNPGPGGWGVLIRRGAAEETRCGGARRRRPTTGWNSRLLSRRCRRCRTAGRSDGPYRQQLRQGRHHPLDRRVEGRRLADRGAQAGEEPRPVAGTGRSPQRPAHRVALGEGPCRQPRQRARRRAGPAGHGALPARGRAAGAKLRPAAQPAGRHAARHSHAQLCRCAGGDRLSGPRLRLPRTPGLRRCRTAGSAMPNWRSATMS